MGTIIRGSVVERKEMKRKKKKSEYEEEELTGDPRLGKRVFCLSLLPRIAVFGTIQNIVRYLNGMEYWRVLNDHTMMIHAPSTSFALYDGPEFQPGTSVKYRLDEGGYWEATVVQPCWSIDHVRFVIRVTNGRDFGTVKVKSGYEFETLPARLSTR